MFDSHVFRKARRDLRLLGVRSVFIGACLSLGVAIYVGGFAAKESLLHTRDSYFDRLHLADLQMILLPPADESELPDLRAIPGVRAVSKRFVRLGNIEMPDGQPLSVATVRLDKNGGNPDVNTLEIIEGRFLDPTRQDEVLIEKTMRDVLGFKVGQKLVLDPYMSAWEVTIVGVAITPEFLLPTANPDIMMPAKGSLGVIFAMHDKVSDSLGEPMYNDLAFLKQPGVSDEALAAAVKAEVAKIPGAGVDRLTPRHQQFGYRYLEEDLKGFGIFIPVVVWLFALVTTVVLLLSFNRLVLTQEREIGALLAQGFAAGRVAVGFMYMSALIAVGGVLGGFALSPVVRHFFAIYYAQAVGLPRPELLMPWQLLAEAGVTGVLLTLGFTCIPLLRIFRLQPVKVMRGNVQEEFRPPSAWAQGMTRVAGGSSGARRHAVRNLLRRPRLTFAVVSLIALSISLASAFRLSQNAWSIYARESFANEHWDAIVSFRVPLKPADAKPILTMNSVSNPRPLVHGTVVIRDGEYERQVRLVGLTTGKPTRYLRLEQGGEFTGEDAAEAIVNNTFSGGHHYQAGSRVTLTTTGGTAFEAIVRGVINDTTMGIVYVPIGFGRRILNQGEQINGAMLDGTIAPHDLKKALFAHEMVQYVSLKVDMEKQVWEYMKVMWALVTIALVLSAALAVMFMLTGMSLTILEREGEYATLRALGFADGGVARMIYWEVVMQGALALVLSVPLTFLFGGYLEDRMAVAWMRVPLVYDPWEMAITAVPVFLFLPVAAWPGIRHVVKLDLVGVLRKRSFG